MRNLLTMMTLVALVCGATLLPMPAGAGGASPDAFHLGQRSGQKGALLDREMGMEEGGGLAALTQTLRELTQPFSVVSVAAHPQDADYGALAYYRYKFGARIGVIFVTRDESGGDMTTLRADETPALRHTRQALAACQRIGADAYFLNLREMGYAKSADEVLNRWGREESVKRLVEAIRRLRPDVLMTAHNARTGDGYQQAVGQLLVTAIAAAAQAPAVKEDAKEDAKEEDVKPATGARNATKAEVVEAAAKEGNSAGWQVARLYQQSDFGDSDTFINLLEQNSVLGGDYAAPNRQGQQQKRFYKLALLAAGERPPFGAPFFESLRLPEKVAKTLTPPLVNGRAASEVLHLREALHAVLLEKLVEKRVEGTIADLRERYGEDFVRVVRYRELLERALVLTLGVRLELRLADRVMARGETLAGELLFHNGGNQPLTVVFHLPETLPTTKASTGVRHSQVMTAQPYSRIAESLRYETTGETRLTPPTAEQLYEESFYPGALLRLSAEPGGESLQGYIEISLGQTTVFLSALQKYRVAAAVEMTVEPALAFLHDWTAPREAAFTVRLRNRQRGANKGALWVVPLALTDDNYEPLRLQFVREDEEKIVRLRATLPIMKPPLSPDILLEFRRERPASPDALAAVKIPVQLLDCRVAENLKVGYFAEADSPLPQALVTLGATSAALSLEDLDAGQHGVMAGNRLNQSCGDLSRFDTIIVDALALLPEKALLAKSGCLLEYARRGGNLLVLYQRPQVWDAVFNRALFSPLPLALSNAQLVDEEALVRFLNPEHPLMTQPNLLSQKDFEGWARSRAFHLPKHWATEYEALLEAADAGEEPRKGLLLVTRHEAGSFVYTSLDLPRQLAAAHPGAYRLLANLVSLPKFLKQ